MFNLLKSEGYKLTRSKAFWICTAIAVALGIIAMVAMQAAINLTSGMGDMLGDYVPPEAGGITVLASLLYSNNAVILCAVVVSIFISFEFHNGTIKNALSRGADRVQYYLSKLMICCAASLIIVLGFIFSSLITGTIIWGFDPAGTATFGNVAALILSHLLIILCFTCAFTFISTAIRSTGGTIAANILIVFLFPTLLSALTMLFKMDYSLNNFWLDGSLSRLASLAPDWSDVWQSILVALFWAAASLAGGILLFRKRDVK